MTSRTHMHDQKRAPHLQKLETADDDCEKHIEISIDWIATLIAFVFILGVIAGGSIVERAHERMGFVEPDYSVTEDHP